ncbi:hypothetical protein ANAEL_02453 [Anaerolineales bacterium]|nr:hypothetical protein ANAEL_02453 [Anaerolineales bacterium]
MNKQMVGWRNINATHIIVSTVGILCGISGIEHGFFETLQGNTAPDTLLIKAIGPADRFWPGGTETALTVIPSFFVTGILAMLAGLLVIIWSAGFVQKKYGSGVFFLLSLFQFLVGGGFAQIFLVLMVTLAATQINAPWKGWRILLPGFLRRFLGQSWLVLLILFALTLLGSMFAAIFGFIPLVSSLLDLNAGNTTGFLYSLAYFMLALLPLTILAGLAHDVERMDFPG